MIRWFKTMSTNEYIRHVKNNHWPPFIKRLWQRNYHDHVIRINDNLDKIREYIINNPTKGQYDCDRDKDG